MSLGINMGNAFHVAVKTYENISKLITYCQTAAEKESHYTPAVTKFLRYRSDNDFQGWLIQEFFLLFQDKNDRILKNRWRNGPVYVLEINLTEEAEPIAIVSRFEYHAINGWSEGCSPASYWVFLRPLRDEQMIHREIGDVSVLTSPNEGSDDYWGLKRVTYQKFLLTDLTAENAADVIFGTFDRLQDVEL